MTVASEGDEDEDKDDDQSSSDQDESNDYLGLPNVHIVIPSSESKLMLRIKSMINFLFISLSTPSLLSNHGPNVNGAELLSLVKAVDIIRPSFVTNVNSIANNTF